MKRKRRQNVEQPHAMNVVNYMVVNAEEMDMVEKECELEEVAQKTQKSCAPKKRKALSKGGMCGICQRVPVDSERHVQLHIKQGSIPLFTCKLCGKDYGSKPHLKRHLLAHSDKRPYSCAVCGKTFRSNMGLVCHRRVHTGEKPFKCETCGKTFALRSTHRYHILTHSGVRPFMCEVCQKTFITKGKLNQHMERHGDKNPCSLCGKVFETAAFLRSHILRMHSHPDATFLQTENDEFKCENCDKTFQNQEEIQKHIESHRFQNCKYCNKLLLPESMEQHFYRVHRDKEEAERITPKKIFTCEHCGKVYYARTSFSHHLGKNCRKTESKIIECAECREVFPCKTKFKEHKIAHKRALEDAKVRDEVIRREKLKKEEKRREKKKKKKSKERYSATRKHKEKKHPCSRKSFHDYNGVGAVASRSPGASAHCSIKTSHAPDGVGAVASRIPDTASQKTPVPLLKRVLASGINGVHMIKIPGTNVALDNVKYVVRPELISVKEVTTTSTVNSKLLTIHRPQLRRLTTPPANLKVFKIPDANATVEDVKYVIHPELTFVRELQTTPTVNSKLVTIHRPKPSTTEGNGSNISTTLLANSNVLKILKPSSVLKVIRLPKLRVDNLKKIAETQKIDHKNLGVDANYDVTIKNKVKKMDHQNLDVEANYDVTINNIVKKMDHQNLEVKVNNDGTINNESILEENGSREFLDGSSKKCLDDPFAQFVSSDRRHRCCKR